ncbi:neural cell adhesion molecule 1-B-like [Cyprinus carpio]|uniref:Neural cell adhesion molecule 1-B-like n=1 Tax=Cyprinus carpio TaxID=7962 RepID=A0A9Q9Y0G8_CYPCA|nr:neural cell adhesion molecule 1-B-like [Cyprinus carpio]
MSRPSLKCSRTPARLRCFSRAPESTGGVPVLKYRAEWRAVGRGKWVQRVYEVKDGEPSPPILEGTLQPKRQFSQKVKWTKQDDGGSPIHTLFVSRLVIGTQREDSDWKPEIRLPNVKNQQGQVQARHSDLQNLIGACSYHRFHGRCDRHEHWSNCWYSYTGVCAALADRGRHLLLPQQVWHPHVPSAASYGNCRCGSGLASFSVPTNSDTVTDTFDLSQSSPVSESTTLTSSITAPPSDSPNLVHMTPPNSSTPKSHTKPSSSSPLSSDPANVTLLVDLGDSPEPQAEVPPVVPSEEPVPVPPPSPFSAVQPASINSKITENELESPESHATLNPISPQSSVAIPLVNHEHEIDGELPLAPDTDVPPQDGSHAVGTAGSNGPSVPAQDEKFLDDDKSTTENADLKKVAPGTGAEPNALTQTNATESKA